MTPELEAQLLNIFMAVADACDGGEQVPDGIRAAYAEALESPDVKELYDSLLGGFDA